MFGEKIKVQKVDLKTLSDLDASLQEGKPVLRFLESYWQSRRAHLLLAVCCILHFEPSVSGMYSVEYWPEQLGCVEPIHRLELPGVPIVGTIRISPPRFATFA